VREGAVIDVGEVSIIIKRVSHRRAVLEVVAPRALPILVKKPEAEG
jgi:hypothetical protein